jgi:hypothetical protein
MYAPLSDGMYFTVYIITAGINQENVPERSGQVLLMKDIYSKAEGVIGWLGQGIECGGDALKTLKKMFGMVADYPKGFEWLRRKPELHGVDHTTPLGIETNASLKDLQKLLSRPFWHRVWIYQELILNSDILLMCGTEIIRLSNESVKNSD